MGKQPPHPLTQLLLLPCLCAQGRAPTNLGDGSSPPGMPPEAPPHPASRDKGPALKGHTCSIWREEGREHQLPPDRSTLAGPGGRGGAGGVGREPEAPPCVLHSQGGAAPQVPLPLSAAVLPLPSPTSPKGMLKSPIFSPRPARLHPYSRHPSILFLSPVRQRPGPCLC